MRIAQVAPLAESVPPKAYGGTERVVSYLTEELVSQGHEVTLFASGDSVTSARLEPVCPRGLRLDRREPLPYHVLLVERVLSRLGEFDVIHFHNDFIHYPFSRRMTIRNLTTLHGRLDLPDYVPLYREYADLPLVSVSNAQRAPLPWAQWQATVHHGLPGNLYSFHSGPGDYLAFLGRISPEKRADRAIEIATRAQVPLRIAAKVDRADRAYFEEAIEPLLRNPWVEFLGEIGEGDKEEFLGNARALLFPIDWPEPFGLVMIEAMACGTPVIAYRNGSVPEIVEDGASGFLVDDVEGAVAAVQRLGTLPRVSCRQQFEQRFTARHMARNYLAAYRSLAPTPAHSSCDPSPTS